MITLYRLLSATLLLVSFGNCNEVAYSFGDSGDHLLGTGNLTEYEGLDIVTSVAAGTTPGKSKTVEEIKTDIILKLNVGNPAVRDKGQRLIGEFSGDGTISQVCSIYEYMAGNWSYVRDPRGIEEFQYSNKSLEYGHGKFSGQGDCDDFSILLASLIESIGCTSRIILAYGPMGGHVYTEVYLGKDEGINSNVDRMIKWLKARYNVTKINTHNDLNTGDVWLNLDWRWEPGGAKHPGGPFFKASNQIPVYPEDSGPRFSLTSIDEPPIINGNLTEYKDSDTVNPAINNEIPDRSPISGKDKTIELIKKEINLKLNVGNSTVRKEGLRLILEYPGDKTINQISSIYDCMVGNWRYAPDPRGMEVFQYSNESLDLGKGKYSGQGDCDDFSILLASLIESIGCTSRIVLGNGPMGGHAYTEVYLGKAEGNDSDVDRMINWLKDQYKVQNINTHTNLDTGDVWLNLDWWKDPDTGIELTKHPGGPFFQATDCTIIPIRENISLVALRPLNDPPLAQFTISPNAPNVGEIVCFDASLSRDIGIEGKIESYLWDFGDECNDTGINVTHIYSHGEKYRVNLTVVDNDGAENYSIQIIEINDLPNPVISFEPEEPLIVDQKIWFDASSSKDNDGKINRYEWDFGDGSYSNNALEQKVYSRDGNMTLNLTVTDDRGATNTASCNIRVWKIRAEINNIAEYEYVPMNLTILGDYTPNKLDKDIWIFVKPTREEIYYPQLGESGGALMRAGKFEMRIKAGEENDSNNQFDIVVALANEDASQYISLWSEDSDKKSGLPELPNGVDEDTRLRVIRSQEKYDQAPHLKELNKSLKGGIIKINNTDNTLIVEKDSGLYGNNLVDNYMNVCGFISQDIRDKHIWVLVYSSNGKWYPQSNNTDIKGHVKNCYLESPTEWRAESWFGSKSGEPTDVVAVLVDDDADRFFDEFQRNCSERINNEGEKGDYPGLMTIELPPGIEEIDRLHVMKR